ncbi:MAG: hypothetical protein AAF206_31440, partial [Bacteroidota bacterium]
MLCVCLFIGWGLSMMLYPSLGDTWLTQWGEKVWGIGLLSAALAAWISGPGRMNRLIAVNLSIGGLSILVIACLRFARSGYQLGQLIEHAIQCALPFLLLVHVWQKSAEPGFEKSLRIIIALTFLGHGFYALGIHAQPSHFIQMVGDILGLSAANSKIFLIVMGFLDLVVVVGMFLPRTSRLVLWYAIIWGTLTALARIIANIESDDLSGSLLRWLPQVMLRLGHGGIPLLLLWRHQKINCLSLVEKAATSA